VLASLLSLAFVSLSACRSPPRALHSFPTRRSSDLRCRAAGVGVPREDRHLHEHRSPGAARSSGARAAGGRAPGPLDHPADRARRSEEHTSELQSHLNLVCRLLLEKKKYYGATNILI